MSIGRRENLQHHEASQQGQDLFHEKSWERSESRLLRNLRQAEEMPTKTMERWEHQLHSVDPRLDVSDIDEAAHVAFLEVQQKLDKAKHRLEERMAAIKKDLPNSRLE